MAKAETRNSGIAPLILALFAVNMFLSVVLVRFGFGGLPVRLFVVVFMLVTIFSFYPNLIIRAIADQKNSILLILYLAICALISSATIGDGFTYALGQIVQIHIQAALGLVLGYCVIWLCGYRATTLVFLAPLLVSSAFAAAQFAGFSPAWSVYDAISSLQPRDMSDFEGFDPHYRALGLSYSPVHLGTQLCLAFAVIFSYRISKIGKFELLNRFDSKLLVATAVIGVVAIFSGNRSPMLGLVIFLCVYLSYAKPLAGFLGAFVAVTAILLGDTIIDALNSSGLRTFNTENSSGQGRAVLSAFGILLFFYKPFGYGLSFDSVSHYPEYWDMLKNFPNSQAITMHALHNYYLMFINKHGILALFTIPFLLRAFQRNPVGVLAFLPYMVHIFYHNDGPLQADFMFWYILPLIAQNPSYYTKARISSAQPT